MPSPLLTFWMDSHTHFIIVYKENNNKKKIYYIPNEMRWCEKDNQRIPKGNRDVSLITDVISTKLEILKFYYLIVHGSFYKKNEKITDFWKKYYLHVKSSFQNAINGK